MLKHLPFLNIPAHKNAVSFSLGQKIYTPEDTESSDLIVDDRPYAGYTYLAAGFHSRSALRKHSWEFNVGIVGPHSYAQDVQDMFHVWIGSPRAKGWSHQLKDELGIEMTFETQWRLLHADFGKGFGSDVISHLGGSLGNVSIYANCGAEARFGWHLPKNFGTCPIRTGCETGSAIYDESDNGIFQDKRIGFHFFVAVDGRGVLRDIFLDGNTFTDSHSVDKETFVADLMAGFSFEYHFFKLNYSYIYRTKQFKTQKNEQIFGAISVSYSY